MAKSVNEYYSEKMKKLLEMQKQNESVATLSSPQNSSHAQRPANKEDKSGRDYYESFRTKAKSQEGQRPPQRPPQRPAQGQRTSKNPMNRTPVDDVREGKPPRQRGSAQTAGNGAPKQSTQPPKRKRINPEQTARDKYEENLKRLEAQKKAQRARIIRKIRDAAVSCVLIAAVFIVMCVVVYRLLFVINDISAAGAVSNTGEEIVSASGVFEGDHLFSFSSKEVGQLITLRCPEVVEVDVERTPPGTIVFNVVEEKPTFYADFYGEYRLLSESLRVLDSVKLEDAKAMGCIRIVLPDVYNATAGLVPEFAKVRNDKYIYSVCTALVESGFAERAVSIDLRDKFDITVGIDSKYLLKLGEWESSETKLKIAAAVLEDDMFKGETKAIIDVSDLSKTSVVVDEGLTVD